MPYKGIWICRDKRTNISADEAFGSPFELAWSDKIWGYDKIYRVMHGGIINADRNENAKRFHPTQKPRALMEWRLQRVLQRKRYKIRPLPWIQRTTAVACKKLNRRFIGIEISPEYCNIAKDRFKQGVLNF